MANVSLRDMLEAGVHFGHQTGRWNPKMRPYIYGARNKVHIIDLSQTVRLLDRACEFVAGTVSQGRRVLFVATKKQAQEIVSRRSARSSTTSRTAGSAASHEPQDDQVGRGQAQGA